MKEVELRGETIKSVYTLAANLIIFEGEEK